MQKVPRLKQLGPRHILATIFLAGLHQRYGRGHALPSVSYANRMWNEKAAQEQLLQMVVHATVSPDYDNVAHFLRHQIKERPAQDGATQYLGASNRFIRSLRIRQRPGPFGPGLRRLEK